MRRSLALVVVLAVVFGLAACARTRDSRTEAEALVDGARWTVEGFKKQQDETGRLLRANLRTAQGVAIFPTVTKGAFFFGAEGGSGVVLARNADGTWSYPAFYNLGAGSFGLQAGFQSAEVVLILRSAKAVKAVIDNQGKFGADLQLTIGEMGGGFEAATTTHLGADIVGFANATGLYGGLSLEGAGIIRRNDLNQAYYGTGATPQKILLEHQETNPQADALRQALASD